MAQKRPETDPFEGMTWDDLEEWAGSAIVSRGRTYQRGRRVQGLARTPAKGLIAWVLGTHRYATRVEVEDGELTSTCTCPYWDTCKHAVAVMLEYLECLKQKKEVPSVTARDRRLRLLHERAEWKTGARKARSGMESRTRKKNVKNMQRGLAPLYDDRKKLLQLRYLLSSSSKAKSSLLLC
jgi:uncharacterized Zn finger protein